MRGSARITAVLDSAGRTRLRDCGGAPPLTPRETGPGLVHLLATAGGPLPGDVADLTIRVGAGASLTVQAVAATVALPGPVPSAPPSVWRVHVSVDAGATMIYLGEPLVAAGGCRHLTDTRIELAATARLVWRDLLVPGRSAEAAGDITTSITVDREGSPVLQQSFSVGPAAPGYAGPAVLSGARCVGTLLLAGPDEWQLSGPVAGTGNAVLMPLAHPGAALGTAIGTAPDVRRQLDAWLPHNPSSRAMSISCTSVVPSPISSTLLSR